MARADILCFACLALFVAHAAADTATSSSALNNNGPFYTTNFGSPIFNNNESLTVGPRGNIFCCSLAIKETREM
jgi:hypothetical protein